jgi:small GTP-binding protein
LTTIGSVSIDVGIDFKIKTIEIDGKKIRMQIWDTAGQERFKTITQTYYKGAMGIIMTYAVNDRETFQSLENWLKQIKMHASENVIKVLIGNKSDCTDREVTRYSHRYHMNKARNSQSHMVWSSSRLVPRKTVTSRKHSIISPGKSKIKFWSKIDHQQELQMSALELPQTSKSSPQRIAAEHAKNECMHTPHSIMTVLRKCISING